MSAARLIVVLTVALVLLPRFAWVATPASGRLEGRLPDNVPVVSIDQARGTVLDALTAIAKQTGWSLAVTAPEPSADFVAGARRRYLEAIEARDRRAVFAGLAAAVVGLVVIVTLLTTTIEPAALVAWLAEAAADLARWVTGVGIVIALVPLSIWMSVILGSTVSILSLVLIARARSSVLVK